jgi:potassium channel subfamily K
MIVILMAVTGASVYYSWVTLITIGYGDISPKSVAGRTFFVIWVEFAVPAVTILAQSLTSTVVATFNDSSNAITFALFAQVQVWQNLLYKFPRLFPYLPTWLRGETPEDLKYMEKGANANGNGKSPSSDSTPDLNALAEQHNNDLLGKVPEAAALARQLALAIKRAARDMTLDTPRQYGYEEWVEFTRLIRFSAIGGPAEALKEEEDEGLIEWDWLAEDSPMMAQQNEAEFVLERLCESLVRYLKRNPPKPEFVDRLKEQGEQALRLRSYVVNDEPEAADTPDQRSMKSGFSRAPSIVPTPKAAASPAAEPAAGTASGLRARDLHPVVEEDHH